MNSKFWPIAIGRLGAIGLPFACLIGGLFGVVMPAQAEPVTSGSAETLGGQLTLATPEAGSTSASDLGQQPLAQATPDSGTPTAQEVIPGRATRSGPSYIGVAGNIGLGGDTALGRTNFTVISKIGLTPRFSARPGVVIGSDPTILVPVTADFPIAPLNDEIDFAVAPYVGGGVAISTGSDSLVRPMLTGGIDVPIADRVTATAQANVAFFDDTEAGLILGVGYNF